MDKNDKIILWFSTLLVLQTLPTWFVSSWYIFDLSVATIIATLVLCLSFVVREHFLRKFLVYIYLIKLTNIISLCAAYKEWGILSYLNMSKPILDIILYIWFVYVFSKYVKGWRYNEKS